MNNLIFCVCLHCGSSWYNMGMNASWNISKNSPVKPPGPVAFFGYIISWQLYISYMATAPSLKVHRFRYESLEHQTRALKMPSCSWIHKRFHRYLWLWAQWKDLRRSWWALTWATPQAEWACWCQESGVHLQVHWTGCCWLGYVCVRWRRCAVIGGSTHGKLSVSYSTYG